MDNIIKTVGVLVIQDAKVLLVEHGETAGHLTGIYGLPAGRPEEGESNEEAALRELEAETGLQSSKEFLEKLPNTYTATIERKDGLKTFSIEVYRCKKFWGELISSEETTPEWVDITKIAELHLLPNVQKIVEENYN